MEVTVPYRFAVEALGLDGQALGDYPLPDLDFEPLLRCAHLEAMRSGVLEACVSLPPARVEPITCRERGAPYVEGFVVMLEGVGQAREFGLSTFAADIVRGAKQLVERGALAAGDEFDYRLCAFRRDEPAARIDFEIEAVDEVLKVCQAPHREGLFPANRGQAYDIPVLIGSNVIDEAVTLAAEAGGVEVGGFLLGQLCHDTQVRDLYVDISALVVATKAVGTEASLRFSPETFAHLQQVLALRHRDETPVGWFHSHPHFCRRCPQEQRRLCLFRKAFFSQADCDVHRTLFPQAYSQALLISDLGADQPSVDLFSWRDGVITPRGFDVADATEQPMVSADQSAGNGNRFAKEKP